MTLHTTITLLLAFALVASWAAIYHHDNDDTDRAAAWGAASLVSAIAAFILGLILASRHLS